VEKPRRGIVKTPGRLNVVWKARTSGEIKGVGVFSGEPFEKSECWGCRLLEDRGDMKGGSGPSAVQTICPGALGVGDAERLVASQQWGAFRGRQAPITKGERENQRKEGECDQRMVTRGRSGPPGKI